MRFAKWTALGLLVAGACAIAVADAASAHSRSRKTERHRVERHRAEHHGHDRHRLSKASRDRKPAHTRVAVPGGVTMIPAGGLKVYCAARSPLMIRKMTQGSGTTVTVICR